MMNLLSLWENTDKLVVVNSYFASLESALKLKSIGMRFIGVVKTAVSGFPMSYLSNVQLLLGKGDSHGLLHCDKESKCQVCVFAWLDRESQNFISATSSLAPGRPSVRLYYHQIEDVETNIESEKNEINITQPKAYVEYYESNIMLNWHKRFHQEGL